MNLSVPVHRITDQTIPLSRAFLNKPGLPFLCENEPAFCDHIITDASHLDWGELNQLTRLAYKALNSKGFLIFWFNSDIKMISSFATGLGFQVQPYPLIWNNLDHRKRADQPNQFPLSYQTAFVCCKPGTSFVRIQRQSVFSCGFPRVGEEFYDELAKPKRLWRWLLKAISLPGQIIFDPFCRTGSLISTAIDFQLQPMGTESDPALYLRLLSNLKTKYSDPKMFGPNVKFT